MSVPRAHLCKLSSAVLWLIGCLCALAALAVEPYQLQTSNPLNQPWRLSYFHELDKEGVRCLAEDHDGNLWFGTRSGVLRYDGIEWKPFGVDQGLPEGPVSAIEKLADRSLVACTESGVFRFDGSRWDKIYPSPNRSIRCHAVTETSDSALWIGCDWGAIVWRDGKATLLTSPSLETLATKVGWFDDVQVLPQRCFPLHDMTGGTGVALVDDRVAVISEQSPLREAGVRVGDRIVRVNDSIEVKRDLSASAGQKLQVTFESFESRQEETVTIAATEIEDKFRAANVECIFEDRHGRVWVATKFGRVCMSADLGDTWVNWPESVANRIGASPVMMESSDGQIWLVSRKRFRGVCRFDGEQWIGERMTNPPEPQFATALAETSDGRIWVGGQNRLYSLQNGSWKTLDPRAANLPSAEQQFAVTSDGALWMVGDEQFAVRVSVSPDEYLSLEGAQYHCTDIDGRRWYIDLATKRIVRAENRSGVSYGTEDDAIESPAAIAALPSGGVLAFGSHDGVTAISSFHQGIWTRRSFPQLARDFVSRGAMVASDGRIWLAAKALRDNDQLGGIIAGMGDDWEHFLPPSAPAYANSLIELPSGHIWASGSYGVMEYDGEKWRSLDHPLLDTPCLHGTIDDQGTIWYGTRRGLLRHRGGQWDLLTTDDGLAANEVTSVAVASDGILWVNTPGGLCRFDGNRFAVVRLPANFGRYFLISESDGSVWLDRAHRYRPDRTPPVARTGQSEFRIDEGSTAVIPVHGVDRWNRTPTEQLEWSYQVDETPWSQYVSGTDQLVVSGLTAGDHIVRVRARDSDWNVSMATDPVRIAVLPPVWMRPWFLVTASFVALAFGWLTWVLVRRGIALRASHRELERARSLLAEQFADRSAQFRAVCDHSPIGIFVTDTEGKVRYFNYRLEKLTGLSTAQASGAGWANAIHPDDRQEIIESWQRTLRFDQPFEHRARFHRSDGSEVWFDVVANRIERDGQSIGYVGAVEDITERLAANERLQVSNQKLQDALEQLRCAQDQAIQRERLSALGQMAAGVAHDINNSLAPLLSYTELLASDPDIEGVSRERIELIRMGVCDTSTIVKRLEHFYRESHNRDFLDAVDLSEVASQTVDFTRPKWQDIAVSDGKRIDVRLEIQERPTIDGHPAQLRSVLTNLIFNAVDAIDQEGTVTIRVRLQGDCGVVEVCDDGRGMTPDQLSRCTEPFYTSKQAGSGLGLSECHGVIRQHGGEIAIESESGKGTVVSISIPGARIPAKTSDPPSVELQRTETTDSIRAQEPANRPRVLYVDDDPTVLRSTVALLTSMGVSVVTATDGHDALAKIQQQSFQLVMCDQGMPGMDGIALLKEVKKRWPQLPLVIISGWALDDLRGGPAPDGFLEKPVALEELQRVLKRHLDSVAAA